jgi:putative FmdB family regulatory protein
MPIFEYACNRCGNEFETLVRASSPTVECPKCHGTELTKKLSAFAAPASSGGDRADLPGPCSSCGNPDGPGSCAFR